jgi:hypothetical protein
MPIRIWTYRHGRFVNVTQRHPRLIRADAESSWRLVQQIRRAKDGREIQGAIAAWAADKYLLGEVADVWARLQPLSDAGVLKGGYGPPSGDAFLRALKRKLQDFGYGSAAAKA